MLELDFIKNRVDLDRLTILLKREQNIIFVDKDSFIGELKPNSTLILSPAFYWIKKEQLPIKYGFEAKKLLPSIFDGFLPEGEYNYKAIRESGNRYILFAYSDKEIIKNLQTLGIKDNLIGDIYFAQSEFLDIDRPLKISNKYALINQDNLLCKIPLDFVDDSQDIEPILREKKLSKSRVNINIFSHSLIDTKSLKKGSSIILVIILALFVKYFLYQNELTKLEAQNIAIVKNYDLPPTKIQLNALKNSLISNSTKELKIRKNISYLFGAPLIAGVEFFHKVSIDKKGIFFEIELKEPKRAEALKEYFQKELNIDKIRVVNNTMQVEIKS